VVDTHIGEKMRVFRQKVKNEPIVIEDIERFKLILIAVKLFPVPFEA